MRRFFHELSPESRRRRFFTVGEPSETLIDSFCDSSDPAAPGDADRAAAASTASCVRSPSARTSTSATARRKPRSPSPTAFRARASATLLLERLAAIAAAHGFRAFEATTLPDNRAMLEVFRDSGFEIRSKSDRRHASTVQLSLDAVGRSRSRPPNARSALATAASLRPLLDAAQPSPSSARRAMPAASAGRVLARASSARGFTGPVYPINPHADRDRRRCAAIASVARRCRAASTSPSSPCPAPPCSASSTTAPPPASSRSSSSPPASRKPAPTGARCSSSWSSRSAATACGWSGPTAWAC